MSPQGTELAVPLSRFKVHQRNSTLAAYLQPFTKSSKEFCGAFAARIKCLSPESLSKESPDEEDKDARKNGASSDIGLTEGDEEYEDDTSEHSKIEANYVGIQEVPFSQLQEPGKMFRVRPINQERVMELARVFTEKKEKKLTSHLTVLLEGDGRYVVVDGNHRFKAMEHVREREEFWDAFKTVTCRVYKKLKSMQALSLGFSLNRDAANVYKMKDYDIVCNLRKILGQMESSLPQDALLGKVYDLLNANSVSTIDINYLIYLNHTLVIIA